MPDRPIQPPSLPPSPITTQSPEKTDARFDQRSRRFDDPEDQVNYNSIDFSLQRLINNDGEAEGPNIPPKLTQGIRIAPPVSFSIKAQFNEVGQTRFVLAWIANPAMDKWQPEYTVYGYWNNSFIDWHGQTANTPQYRGPLQAAVKVKGSPLEFVVPTAYPIPVVFAIATRISNGMQTPEDSMPTVAAQCDPIQHKFAKVDTTYTVSPSDDVILCDTTAAGFTITFPLVTSVPDGKEMWVKNVAVVNNLTVAAAGTDTIEGAATYIVAPTVYHIFLADRGSSTWRVF